MDIQGLDFSYNQQQVFAKLSFKPEAPLTWIIGPPGSGKTTLLKLLAGVLQPNSVDKFEVPSAVGLIIQEPTLLPWLTGIDNITGLARVSSDRLFNSSLYPLIAPFAQKRAYQMSYGQQRLIELIRLLLLAPPLICFDEPFNFLDLKSRGVLLSYIESVSTRESDLIITAHDQSEVLETSGEVLSVSGGFPISCLKIERAL